MNINHKLITLGLALSLLGSTSALARPTPHFENGCLWCKKESVESHVPTAKTSSPPASARRPSASTMKDDWPDNMILG
jgi:hypothetical protein